MKLIILNSSFFYTFEVDVSNNQIKQQEWAEKNIIINYKLN